MSQFFRYFRTFALILLLVSLALCVLGFYQLTQTTNNYLRGAESYTCGAFAYDMKEPDTNRFGAMAIATFAYGMNPEGKKAQQNEDAIADQGMSYAVQKVYALCHNQPAGTRIFSLVAQSITGVDVSPTTVSTTAVVSTTATVTGTTVASPTNPK